VPTEANLVVERKMGLPTIRDDSALTGIGKLREILDTVPILSGSDYKKLSAAMLMIELDRYLKGDKKVDVMKLKAWVDELSKDAPGESGDAAKVKIEELLGRVTSEHK